jgi:hypothetical protein
MKSLVLSLLLVISVPIWAQVANFDNSPYNMQNSPYNMDNSAYNASATNGVYDNTGNRLGYEVKAPSGVTNYFDNSGNRIGYTPAKK